MTTPLFSILHATFGRPQKAYEAMKRFRSRSSMAYCHEYIFAVNSDDLTVSVLRALLAKDDPIVQWARVEVVEDHFKGSAPAWDAAAKASKGHILVQAQDDVEPPEEWDHLLIEKIMAEVPEPKWQTVPFFIQIADGYRKDALMCTAICSRPYYELKGEFLHSGYLSVFSDDEFSVRAYCDAADRVCQWIEARDIVFKHEHCYHNPAVPSDSTYLRENSAEAYTHGQKLFLERNQRQLNRGFRTW